jgi:hypothetical protein
MFALAALAPLLAGCGTTKWSDSPRTATEQLLISDAVDRAISEIDFAALADKHVYLDTRFIITTLDQNYVVSTLRQHMLASGCIIKDKADDATYIVEVRTGSLGTNRQDLLFGMPSTTLPTVGLLPTGAATIPEIALVKRTNQQGVCKIACFAYDRMSGRPVWQSGNHKVASGAKDIWVMGAGPFQRGTIYDGTAFAGEKFSVPLVDDSTTPPKSSVATKKVFNSEDQSDDDGQPSEVSKVSYLAPLPDSSSAQPAPASATATANANSVPPASGGAAAPPAAPASTPGAGAGATNPSGDAKPDPLPKAAYTPPPPPAVAAAPAPPAATGLQGNLTPQAILPPTSNPASSTAGAIQTYNLARDVWDRPK